MPSSSVVTLRYPEATEFRLSENAPRVGDVLKRNGDSWIVERVKEENDGMTVFTLRPGLEPTRTP